MLVLTEDDVAAVLDLPALLPIVEEAFLAQGRGAVERPARPHFPVGTGLDPEGAERPLGTALAMPAYVHGADHYAAKLAAVHEGNCDRGLPTVNAVVTLFDARTGLPTALVAGNRITNARTGCIGGLAARELTDAPVTLGVLGAGTQARWQARAIAVATDLDAVRVYSPSESRDACAADLRAELAADVRAVDSPAAAVRGASAVVTATTSAEPVFDGDDLDAGALVVAVGAYAASMRELDARTFDRAAAVFGDVPEGVVETGDALGAGLDAADVTPFSDVLDGHAGRDCSDDIVVVESVGSAVLDAATTEHVYRTARAADVGVGIDLSGG